MSRPGYVDKRGSARDRKRRRAWVLRTFDVELGDDRARCRLRLAADCVDVVDERTLSVDRIELGGSYERSNIQPACMPCQSKQGGYAAISLPGHRAMIDEYRAARDARDALRESNMPAPTSVPGVAHSGVAMHQLEDDDFATHVPAVTFREWLIEWGASRAEPDPGWP